MSVRIPMDNKWINATHDFVERNGNEIYRLKLQSGVISSAKHADRLFEEFGCRVVRTVEDAYHSRVELEFEKEEDATLFLLRWM